MADSLSVSPDLFCPLFCSERYFWDRVVLYGIRWYASHVGAASIWGTRPNTCVASNSLFPRPVCLWIFIGGHILGIDLSDGCVRYPQNPMITGKSVY